MISAIPIIVNILLYIALAVLIYNYYSDIMGLVVRDPNTVLQKILYWFFFVFFMIFVIAFFIFTFTIVGGVILSPFNNELAKRTYKILQRNSVSTPNKTTLLAETYGSIKLELKKLLFVFTPIFLLYIVGIFLPILAMLALVLGFWAVTFEYMDYIMEQKGLTLSERIKTMLSNPIACTAFGFVVSIVVSIPILGLIGIPSSVAGATKLFIDIQK